LEKNGRDVRLRLDQGIKQKDYLTWKYREFKNLATSKPRIITEFHKIKQVNITRAHFSTYTNKIFTFWKNIFYKERIKIIPKNINNILKSPLSLAVWFMDDGYKRNDCNALRISTDSFTLEEQQLLVKCLKKNFGVNSKIHKKGKTFNIYIPNNSAKRFCQIIKPFIVNSLLYKVSLTP